MTAPSRKPPMSPCCMARIAALGSGAAPDLSRTWPPKVPLSVSSELGLGHGPDERLHVAVTLLRVLRLDGQESARRVLLDFLDRQRQGVFLFLPEAEPQPRFRVEGRGGIAAR